MAYNSFTPIGYQGYYQQPSLNPGNTPLQPYNSSIIWVQGETGAKSYMVAPNQTVQLWDSENQVIYLKSADSSGMPSMKILDYKIRNSSQLQEDNRIQLSKEEFVTKEELKKFQERIEEKLKGILDGGSKHEQSAV